MALPRDEPFVWVTWLSSLLSGATTCEWAAWFKAHHFYSRRPREGDLAKYQIEHTALLMQVRDQLRADGYTVFTERQNEFKIRGSVGILAGRPDLVAVKDSTAWVIDVKTRSMTVSHRVQVMLYMWALPKAFPAYRGLRFDGRLICPAGELDVPAEDVDQQFIARVRKALHRICNEVEPLKSPSYGECRYCDIGGDDCAERMDNNDVVESRTDEF
jgi:CRISPR/Cas system-associated exonuclease Cas4 (RecB family)